VPNSIYLHAHDGLSVMISNRAARHVLDAALSQRGLTPDSVDARAMEDLLLGPVFRGLEPILPKDGLKRQLQRLAAGVSELEAPEEEALAFLVPAGRNIYPKPQPRLAAQPVAAPLSLEKLEAMALALAGLEHVRFALALRGSEVVVFRGEGYDAATLSGLGLVALKLLRRGGEVRAYSLAHAKGQLFMLPFLDDTIMMIGEPQLSLGMVLGTAAALKEDL
jgi:hypothetical protein